MKKVKKKEVDYKRIPYRVIIYILGEFLEFYIYEEGLIIHLDHPYIRFNNSMIKQFYGKFLLDRTRKIFLVVRSIKMDLGVFESFSEGRVDYSLSSLIYEMRKRELPVKKLLHIDLGGTKSKSYLTKKFSMLHSLRSLANIRIPYSMFYHQKTFQRISNSKLRSFHVVLTNFEKGIIEVVEKLKTLTWLTIFCHGIFYEESNRVNVFNHPNLRHFELEFSKLEIMRSSIKLIMGKLPKLQSVKFKYINIPYDMMLGIFKLYNLKTMNFINCEVDYVEYRRLDLGPLFGLDSMLEEVYLENCFSFYKNFYFNVFRTHQLRLVKVKFTSRLRWWLIRKIRDTEFLCFLKKSVRVKKDFIHTMKITNNTYEGTFIRAPKKNEETSVRVT